MLEIAQAPCAVHGGSAERDDDKQQVRSERLSRSCGGASCSAVARTVAAETPGVPVALGSFEFEIPSQSHGWAFAAD